jgi:prepilin-type N-terminal cleavage/methylation domain-containing protein/prepilin-type processing-associated H-X9-DG protein
MKAVICRFDAGFDESRISRSAEVLRDIMDFEVSQMKRHGFTLVEMLVVLAIMVVLSALLFPVFSHVREKGRRTSCQSNLKQIGLALQQYTSDHDGIYPALTSVSYSPQGEAKQLKWSDMLQPYLKSTAVFDCATHTERYPAGVETPATPMLDEITGDYDYDWFAIPNAQHKHNRYGQNVTEMQVEFPAQAAMIYDAGWIGQEKSLYYLQAYEEDSNGDHTCYHSAHNGGANFLFADGHVKWMSVDQQANHSPHPLAPWTDWSPYE